MKKLFAFVFLALSIITTAGCTTNVVNNGSNNSNNSNVTPTAAPKYTLNDVSKHATSSDCWMAINGKVYNVTAYISQHPGGREITEGCGKDASTLFNTQGGEGAHSNVARSELQDLYIGDLTN